MSNQKKLLVLILVLAAALRLAAILKYGHFWDDEMFSFIYSQKAWGDSLKFWLWETNPPFHLLFLKLWWLVFPATEFFARLPSLLAGVLSVYVIYILGKKMFGEKTALFSALALAFWPYHIFLSATARGYAFLLFFGLLAVNFFYNLFLAGQKTFKNYSLFALADLLLLYTHLTGLIVIFGQFIFLLLTDRREIKNWFKANLAPAALYLVWAVPAFAFKTNAESLGASWFMNLFHGFTDIMRSLNPLFGGPTWWPYSLILLLLILSGTVAAWRKQPTNQLLDKNFLLINILVFLPIICAGFFGLWNIKFFVIALPFLALLLAYLVNLYISSSLGAAVLIVALCLPGLYGLNRLLPIENWKTVNDYLLQEKNSQKQIFIYNNFILKPQFDRYYRGAVPALAYYFYGDEGHKNWDYYFISKNYLRLRHSDIEIKTWLTQNKIEENKEIFLLEEKNLGIDISKVLSAEGWVLKDTYTPRLLGDRPILHYVKP